MDRLGNYLPPDLILQHLLVPGGIFRQEHQYGSEDPKRRYFFILNNDPPRDDELLVVTASTQIRKRLKHTFRGALVIIEPKEYTPFTEKSVIDCSYPQIVPKDRFMQSVASTP